MFLTVFLRAIYFTLVIIDSNFGREFNSKKKRFFSWLAKLLKKRQIYPKLFLEQVC